MGNVQTADHVDILGNFNVLEDMIRIVTNHSAGIILTFKLTESDISEQILSNIVEMSDRVPLQ